MIRIIIVISALLAGLILGPEISANKGYILISFDSYTTYETTIINAIFIAIVFYFLLLLAEWLVRKLLSMSSLTRGWFGQRQSRKAQKNNLLGMWALFEGKSKQAQKLLAQSAKSSETPALTYIAAARAAQQQGKYDLRDEYLEQAREGQKGGQLAVGLVRVEMQLEAQQYESALATLDALDKKFAKNKRISELYLSVYPALDKWQEYLHLLNTKRNLFSFNELEFATVQLDAYRHLFKQFASHSGESLQSYWENSAPRWMRKEVSYQKALLDAYIDTDNDKFAEQFLLEKLHKQFSVPLLAYLEKLEISDYYPLILLLEKKLQKESQTALIHQALAKLMVKENKTAAAIEHLKVSLVTLPNVADFALLANLLEKDDYSEQANHYYRQGLLFAAAL